MKRSPTSDLSKAPLGEIFIEPATNEDSASAKALTFALAQDFWNWVRLYKYVAPNGAFL